MTKPASPLSAPRDTYSSFAGTEAGAIAAHLAYRQVVYPVQDARRQGNQRGGVTNVVRRGLLGNTAWARSMHAKLVIKRRWHPESAAKTQPTDGRHVRTLTVEGGTESAATQQRRKQILVKRRTT